jgi:hypothetical protein
LHEVHNHQETRLTDFEREYDAIKDETTSIPFGFWRELDILKKQTAALIRKPVDELIELVKQIKIPNDREARTHGMNEFIRNCKQKKTDISLGLTERKKQIRELFANSFVYSPLVMIPQPYYTTDGNEQKKLYVKYANQVLEQVRYFMANGNSPNKYKLDIAKHKQTLEEALEATERDNGMLYSKMETSISSLNSQFLFLFQNARDVCIAYSINNFVHFVYQNFF